MLTKINCESPQTPLESLIVRALGEMKTLGHSEKPHKEYLRIWRHLLQFAEERNERELSVGLASDFLSKSKVARPFPGCSRKRRLGRMMTARRAVRSLLYFMCHERWDPRRAGCLHRMLPPIHTDSREASTPLEATMISALNAMRSEGYPESTREDYSLIWRHMLEFALRQNRTELSDKFCQDFLAASGSLHENRMDKVRYMVRSLSHHASHGMWRPCRLSGKEAPVLPTLFARDLQAYLSHLKDECLCSSATLVSHKRYLGQFLAFLGSKGIQSWKRFRPALLTEFFMAKGHLQASSLEIISKMLCRFLRFVLMTGRLGRDWSGHVPRFRGFADQHVPAVWTSSMIDTMLHSIDRDWPKGKRDYAVLLLACRLGMRPSDIRALRLESLRWDDNRIEYTQRKTGRRIVLPLTCEIGDALIDYLFHSRPASIHREVFLRTVAPYRPLGKGLTSILDKYCPNPRAAFPNQRMGINSLRHSVARELLAIGTPLETIAEVLGHGSLNSTRVYAKVDVKQLRTAALDPEEVYHA